MVAALVLAMAALGRERRRVAVFQGLSSDHSFFASLGNKLLPFGDAKQIDCEFVLLDGKAKKLQLDRWGPGGKSFDFVGLYLPEGVAHADGAVSKLLDTKGSKKVGFLKITGSMDAATVKTFHAAFDALKGMTALLLDCRSMGGGADDCAWEMCGRLFSKGADNGRNGRIEASGAWQFDGPVVMLQDEMEVSSAETFTWALSETKRVISVGSAAGGKAGKERKDDLTPDPAMRLGMTILGVLQCGVEGEGAGERRAREVLRRRPRRRDRARAGGTEPGWRLAARQAGEGGEGGVCGAGRAARAGRPDAGGRCGDAQGVARPAWCDADRAVREGAAVEVRRPCEVGFRLLGVATVIAAAIASGQGTPQKPDRPKQAGGAAAAVSALVAYLPFEYGTTVNVFLGNGAGSHADEWNWFAIDFSPLAEGTPVVAMASGTVVYVKEDTAGPTGDWNDNNEISIQAADGSVLLYHHLRKEGAIVAVGDRVLAGDRIGWSGNTGKSSGPHLHVDRREGSRTGRSIPLHFTEAPDVDGVLKVGQSVTSRNRLRVGALAEVLELAEEYDLCASLEARSAIADELRKLADDANAKKAAAALRNAAGRADLVQLYDDARGRLLEQWNSDAKAALTDLDHAIAEYPVNDALLLARVALLDFAGGELDKTLRERLATLRAGVGADWNATERPFQEQGEFRKALAAALAADRFAGHAMRDGKRADWKAVAKLYRAALAKGRDRRALAGLQARLDAITARLQ